LIIIIKNKSILIYERLKASSKILGNKLKKVELKLELNLISIILVLIKIK
jgi:hypothetical protein